MSVCVYTYMFINLTYHQKSYYNMELTLLLLCVYFFNYIYMNTFIMTYQTDIRYLLYIYYLPYLSLASYY